MQFEITPEFLASQGLSPTFPERFWAKVNKDGPVPSHCQHLGKCWLWVGARTAQGYGNIGKGTHKYGNILAHVASWVIHCGPVPKGVQVNHFCDVKRCIRIEHLHLGNHFTNAQEAKDRNLIHYGEKNWNCKLTREQVEEIKRRFVRGKRGVPGSGNYRELMREFQVGMWTIHAIIAGRSRTKG